MCSDNDKLNKSAAFLEERGWTRQIAGDADFDAACAALDKVREMRLGLIAAGKYGVGKTSLIQAIIGKYDVFKVRLAITTEPLTPAWQDNWSAHVYERDIWLDDLGAEPLVNEYGIKLDLAGDFIVRWHELHDPGRRMFITTNLTAAEIDARYGGRVLSRLKDICIPLRLTGNDKRSWRK